MTLRQYAKAATQGMAPAFDLAAFMGMEGHTVRIHDRAHFGRGIPVVREGYHDTEAPPLPQTWTGWWEHPFKISTIERLFRLKCLKDNLQCHLMTVEVTLQKVTNAEPCEIFAGVNAGMAGQTKYWLTPDIWQALVAGMRPFFFGEDETENDEQHKAKILQRHRSMN